jgi:hypothetical protein
MNFFFTLLNNKIKIFGYRIIPVVFIVAYFTALLLSQKFYGSYTFAAKYLFLDAIPYFVDLKILLCGIDSIRNNQNPYDAICFGGVAYFNYPLIWGVFAAIPLLTLSNYLFIGFGLALILYILIFKFIGKINLFESIIYSLYLVSPSVVLAFERGNSDLIILILLLSILYIKNKVQIQAAILLFISMLKLFPVGAISMLLIDKLNIRIRFIVFVAFLFLFSMYVYIFIDNITLVSHKTPRPYGGMSYGLGDIPSMVYGHFNNYKTFIFISFISFMLIWLSFFYIKTFPILRKMIVEDDMKGKAFLMGSGIFVSTCVIGFNWEYRLIFLLLTLPQIFKWVKKSRHISYLAIILILLIVWQTAISGIFYSIGFRYYNFVSALLIILLFSFYSCILIHCTHDFLKKLYNRFQISNF